MSGSIITVGLSEQLNGTYLRLFGYRHMPILSCSEIEDAFPHIGDRSYYAIVINCQSIELEAVEKIVKAIRKESFIPVLILSDIDNTASILENGADVCLPCSCDPFVIVSHTMALSRRYAVFDRNEPLPVGARIIRRGPLTLDPLRCQAFLLDRELELTRREFKLLYHFMENPGIVFTPEQVCEIVWSTDYDYNRDISSVVSKLRKKLMDNSASPRYIQTVHGVGYKFLVS